LPDRRITLDRLNQEADAMAVFPQLTRREALGLDPAGLKLAGKLADKRGLPGPGSAGQQKPRYLARHVSHSARLPAR
jgi:hypothetical protein